MPGSRLEIRQADNIAQQLGLRLIAPDRPGYGHTDGQHEGCLIAWSKLISQLAERLKLDQFSVLGFSGGGPYAMACADALPQQVKHVTLVSSLAPFQAPAMQSHINAEFKPLYELAADDYDAAIQHMSQLATSPSALMAMMRSPLPPSDISVFENQCFAKHYLQNLTLAIRQGVNGLVNDLRCVTLPWQFKVEDIQQPTAVWHGHDDKNVGFAVAEYLADTIKHSSRHFLKNKGHFYLFEQWPQVLQNIKVNTT